MASWFLIAIASIAAIGIIMLTGVNLINVMAAETGQTDAIAKFNQLPDLILANSWQAPNGSIYLPAASPAGPGAIEGVATLPAWVRSRGVLATSAQVIYCPFAPGAASPTADYFNPDGTRYSVSVTNNASRAYVTGGRPNYADAASNPDLAGFVMMPDNRSDTYSGCNTITRSGSAYSAPGMLVRPILLSRSAEERAGLSNVRVLYAVASGSGTGDTPSSPTTFAKALARWRASSWANTRIEVSNAHSVTAAELTTSGVGYIAKPAGSTLTISGVNRATSIITAGGEAVINFPVNLTLVNVSLSANTMISVAPRHKFEAIGSAIGPVLLNGDSQAVLNGTDVRNNSMTSMSALPLFDVKSGARLMLTGGAVLTQAFANNVAQIASGGSIDLTNAAVTINGAGSRHTVQAGGYMRLMTSTITVPARNSATFVSNGNLSMNGSTVVNNAASMNQGVMELANGSRTTIAYSTISVPNRAATQRSVRSFNAAIVAGEGSTIQGCWEDVTGANVFALSDPVTANANSSVGDDEAEPVLSGTPTAAAIEANAQARQRNYQRAMARLRNSSRWTCNL